MHSNSDYYLQKYQTARLSAPTRDYFQGTSTSRPLWNSSYFTSTPKLRSSIHHDDSYSQFLEQKINKRLKELLPKLDSSVLSHSELTRRLMENDAYLNSFIKKDRYDLAHQYSSKNFNPAQSILRSSQTDIQLELLKQRIKNEVYSPPLAQSMYMTQSVCLKKSTENEIRKSAIQDRMDVIATNLRTYNTPVQPTRSYSTQIDGKRIRYSVQTNQSVEKPREIRDSVIVSQMRKAARKNYNEVRNSVIDDTQETISVEDANIELDKSRFVTFNLAKVDQPKVNVFYSEIQPNQRSNSVRPFQNVEVSTPKVSTFRASTPVVTQSHSNQTNERIIQHSTPMKTVHRIKLGSRQSVSPGIVCKRTTESLSNHKKTEIPSQFYHSRVITNEPRFASRIQPNLQLNEHIPLNSPGVRTHIIQNFPSQITKVIRRSVPLQRFEYIPTTESRLFEMNASQFDVSPVKSILKKGHQSSKKKKVVIDENQNQFKEFQKNSPRRIEFMTVIPQMEIETNPNKERQLYQRTISHLGNKITPFEDIHLNNNAGWVSTYERR